MFLEDHLTPLFQLAEDPFSTFATQPLNEQGNQTDDIDLHLQNFAMMLTKQLTRAVDKDDHYQSVVFVFIPFTTTQSAYLISVWKGITENTSIEHF